MILVTSPSFASGLGLEIQIRTEMRHDWSFIADAALKTGDEVLEVGNRAVYHYNGVLGEKYTKNTELPELSGFPVTHFNYGAKRHKFEVDLGCKGKVIIKVYNEFLSVAVDDADQDDFGDSVGLMGSFHTGELVTREGKVIEDTNEFGLNWQVRDFERMLFHEAKGPQFPQTCNMPSPKKIKRRRLLESMVSYKNAEKACADWDEESRESCIFDVLSTGDLAMADAGAM
jgi:hypothetical protein